MSAAGPRASAAPQPRYHAAMNTIPRLIAAAALCAALSACGNKGPLVQADAPATPAVEPAPAATQQGTDAQPADPATTGESVPPVATPAAAPGVPVQEGQPAPAQGDGTP